MFCFSHGLSLQVDPVGAMNKSIKNGIGNCRVFDQVMPDANGILAGDQSGRLADAFLKYL